MRQRVEGNTPTALYSAPREFLIGLTLLARGLGMWVSSPRLMALGMLPALIAFMILAAAFATLCVFIGPIAHVVTPFADAWSDGPRLGAHIVGGAAVLGTALLICLLLFVVVTLAMGDPFYQRIAFRTEERCGGASYWGEPPWWRGLLDNVRFGLGSLAAAIGLFVVGFLPLLGQTVAPILGVLVGGWYLTLELTAIPLEQRGLSLRDRRMVLRRQRFATLGFGTGVFMLFLIPFGAVVAMPGAVAGATLLARRGLGLPVEVNQVDPDVAGSHR